MFKTLVGFALSLTLTWCGWLVGGEVGAATIPTTYSFGSNADGQTGLGTTSGNTLVATPIVTSNLGDMAITQVAAGGLHSLLLAENGTVYSFGNNESGQTGLATDSGSATVATAINTSNLGGQAIKQVSAGRFHSLLLAEDGSVFSFGSNASGKTGLGTTNGTTLVATPIDTSNLADLAITQVAAGSDHNLLLAEDGSVYSFGFNSGGRTGLGTTSGSTTLATAIDTSMLGGRAIKQVAAGRFHSLLLAEDGTVFSFGSNTFGRTGLGADSGSTTVATPINTSNLGGRVIKQVAAGRAHSLLLADDGTVFSIGDNADGQTGLGTDTGETLVATAIDMTNLTGKTVTQIAAASFHSLLLADDGTVFSFGLNELGRTGLNTTDDKTLVATQIDAINLAGPYGRVIDISAGGGHSLLLAVPEPGALALLAIAGCVLLAHRDERGCWRRTPPRRIYPRRSPGRAAT